MVDRTPIFKTREWKARERLSAAVESRKHLECMVTFWSGKLVEVQKHLDDAKSNLARVTAEEQQLRQEIVPQAVETDRSERKAQLLAEMAKMKEQLAKLEASEL